MSTQRTAILLLAAGSSSRLGQPKQLLLLDGKTLLRRLAENALLVAENVFVVLGAHGTLIRPTLENLPLHIVQNEGWASGMAGSVRCGLAAAVAQVVDLEAVILSVCDQPMLTGAVFQKLIDQKKGSGKGIIASGYGGTSGVPVLFSAQYFHKIMALDGGRGAKNMIAENPEDLAIVGFPGGEWDIDTVEEFTNHDLRVTPNPHDPCLKMNPRTHVKYS